MNPMDARTVNYAEASLLARHKVLRQTYVLLGMNVLFSALCAFIGMQLHIGRMPWLISMVAMFVLVPLIQANRNSGLGIVLLFALTGAMGLFLSSTLQAFVSAGAGGVVVKALIGSAVIFFGLSAYALMSGRNFSFLGGFLFVGVMVGFLAMIGAMFFHLTALQLVVSGAFLVVFSGYVLYDTSNIIHGVETNYVMATLSLFMNLLNIFISLLNILGMTRNN